VGPDQAELRHNEIDCQYRFQPRGDELRLALGRLIGVVVPILSALCDSSNFFSAAISSPYANCDRFGPVTKGLKISPTGQIPVVLTVFATRRAIASTGAMLLSGQEAPVGSRP
jgi:hypothetical protein